MMSDKRYFKIEYDEEWYLFDSTTISEQLVKEQAEYGYGVFANSLSPSEVEGLLNEQQATINELQSIINHIKCEENCGDYDYCCETVCSLYKEIKHLKEENEQLRTQLAICQQSKKDDGQFKVWEVPPIRSGMRVSTTTIDDEQKRDSKRWRWSE